MAPVSPATPLQASGNNSDANAWRTQAVPMPKTWDNEEDGKWFDVFQTIPSECLFARELSAQMELKKIMTKEPTALTKKEVAERCTMVDQVVDISIRRRGEILESLDCIAWKTQRIPVHLEESDMNFMEAFRDEALDAWLEPDERKLQSALKTLTLKEPTSLDDNELLARSEAVEELLEMEDARRQELVDLMQQQKKIDNHKLCC